MPDDSAATMQNWGWGFASSLLLHVLLLLAFISYQPAAIAPVAEQSVPVELVEPDSQPEQPKQPAKPQAKPQSKPEPAQPQETSPSSKGSLVFKSASSEPQDNKDRQADPLSEASGRPDAALPQGEKDQTSQTAKQQATPQSLQDDQSTTESILNSSNESQSPSENAVVQNAPIPQSKPTQIAPHQAPNEDTNAKTVRPNLVTAKRIYTRDALSDPHVRQAMGQMTAEQRTTQLCLTESVAQLMAKKGRAGSSPLIANPRGSIAGLVLTNNEMAGLIDGKWYPLSYKCEVNAARNVIVSYQFAIGQPISEREWDKRYGKPNSQPDWGNVGQ